METMSSRSRRATAEKEQGDGSRPSSVNKLLLCVCLVLMAACSYLVYSWGPIDRENIGGVVSSEFLSYGPIDVVYTWVNGTDPRWKREKEYWHKHWIASLTGQPLPKKPEDTAHVKGNDVSNSDNRFRDNEELRYSLRSLEKYAPWIRHVYIVTDGQIPSWLDIESPKVSIVKHSEIFENASHLPVFSSPAIEWNLDRIPGLSDMFLYFNDDVFLGSHVHPEDFVSPKGVQKVYFAWEIPFCAQGCWDAWLQNGQCNKECNVTACDYDMGDCGCTVAMDGTTHCDPIKIASIQEAAPKPPKVADHICSGACHYRWLGDNTCDHSCNISTCGFDAGDCGMNLLNADLLHRVDVVHDETLVQVPLEANATYLNLTHVFGVNGSVNSAVHDNDALIRHATVFESAMMLLLVFGRDTEGMPMTSSATISVEGHDVDGSAIQLQLNLVRGAHWLPSARNGGFFTYRNHSIKPKHVKLPFGFRHAHLQLADADAHHGPATPPLPWSVGENDDEKSAPILEIHLPFNITDKRIKPGQIVVLRMDGQFRMHDDVEDYHAEAIQSCQLRVPSQYTTQDAEGSSLGDDIKGQDMSEWGSPQQSAPEAINVQRPSDLSETNQASTIAKPESHSSVGNEQSLDGGSHGNQEELEPYLPDIPLCNLNGDNGAIMRLYLPTHALRIVADAEHPLTSSESSDGRTESNEFSDHTLKIETSGSDQANLPRDDANNFTSADPPQIVDGQICFLNEDDVSKKYCYAIAVGNFHSHRVLAKRNPPIIQKPKPEFVYEPHVCEASERIELLERCIDASERSLGLSRLICKPDEEPHPHVQEALLAREAMDPKRQNEEEGRRLACEAKMKRLENRARERQADATRLAARGSIDLMIAEAQSYFRSALDKLGISLVEETEEDIDDIEYDDVCKPFSMEENREETPISAANAEALLSKDTFGDSLRHVNKLYNRVFGKATSRRRVPSHMPFLLQKKIIREIKSQWRKEYEETSAHRFRHPQDMQFSFSYFHYLMNRYKLHPPTLEYIWKEYLDANRNGILDENEVLTVASLAFGDYPPDTFVDEVRTCLQPPKQDKVMEKSTAKGKVLVAETLTPHITFESLATCKKISDKLIKNVRKEKQFELMPEDEVTFHMLSEQYRYAWNQMLGTRARRTKFVCINDDMKFPNPSVSQILHELFLSIWPKRSQFELPYHLKNRYAHIDEYAEAQSRRQKYMGALAGVLILLITIFWTDLKALFGFQDLARARAESASQLSAELMRQDEQED